MFATLIGTALSGLGETPFAIDAPSFLLMPLVPAHPCAKASTKVAYRFVIVF